MDTPGVRTRIVPIGNSRGVRIPKPILEQSGVGDEVEIYVVDRQIVIRGASRPRQGWQDSFRAMSAEGDDSLLDDDALAATVWDREEWEW